MTQLDLILETYVHAGAEEVSGAVGAPEFSRRLWSQWNVAVDEDRGLEGVRWVLDDPVFTGSCEVWIEAVAADGCILHTFVRVDRPGRQVTAWHRRRTRSGIVKTLWRLKDDVEGGDAARAG